MAQQFNRMKYFLWLILSTGCLNAQIGDSRKTITTKNENCTQLLITDDHIIFQCKDDKDLYWFNTDGFCYSHAWEYEDNIDKYNTLLASLKNHEFEFSETKEMKVPLKDINATAQIYFDSNFLMVVLFKTDLYGNSGRRCIVFFNSFLNK